MTLGSADRARQVGDVLDPRVADLDERLIRKLSFERGHKTRGGFAGRVGDNMKLDRLRNHPRAIVPDAAYVRPPPS